MLDGPRVFGDELWRRSKALGQIEVRWPVVVMRPSHTFDLDDVEIFLELMRRLADFGRPCAVVYDVRNWGIPSARVRARFAEGQRTLSQRAKGVYLADAFVIRNRVFRGVVTALNWFARPHWKQGFFADCIEAEAWCLAQVQRKHT